VHIYVQRLTKMPCMISHLVLFRKKKSETVRTVEMKLKENSFKTVLKHFCFSFISLCGQF